MAQCQGVSAQTLHERKFALFSLLALLLFVPAKSTPAQDSARTPDRASASAIADADPKKDASRSPGWVVLPIDEYRSLRARAFPAEHDPEPPPVDATLTRVDYDLRVSNIRVHLDLAADLPMTAADPHQLQQVFLNMVNNAVDAILERSTDGDL